jgi:GNAT superfamily N-acetyltransferase
MHIKQLDPKTASDEFLAIANDSANVMRKETLPDDPPRPLADFAGMVRNLPPMVRATMWLALNEDESRAVGYAVAFFLLAEENQHLLQYEVYVEPDARRAGVGRQLLQQVAEMARRENRRLMVTETSDRIPAGETSMQRLGAKKGLAMRVSQLRLSELDREMLRQWQERAPERAAGFDLGLWEGAYPEDDLPAIAELHEAMNLAPTEDLEIEDERFTPDRLRQMEQMIFSRGDERWTMYVRERATGEFAGYTEVMWNPNRPAVAMQGATAVWPKFRNKGLGRWLKAAMLEKIIQERPQAKFVRTGNAESNAAMLNINVALGFKPYQSEIFWQVETDKVIAYLAGEAVASEA